MVGADRRSVNSNVRPRLPRQASGPTPDATLHYGAQLGPTGAGTTTMTRRTQIRRSALAVTVAVALLGAGCGGGGDDSSTEAATATPAPAVTGPLSKSEYIAHADAICAQNTSDATAAAFEQFGDSPPSSEEAQQFGTDVFVPTLEKHLGELRALPAPKGDGKDVAQVWDEVQSGLDAIKADPSLFLAPNQGGAFDRATELARKYGFKQCGSSRGA